MAKNRKFQITYGCAARSRAFMSSFAKAAKLKIPAQAARRRLSARHRGQKKRFVRSKRTTPTKWKRAPKRKRHMRKDDSTNTYYYGGKSPRKPTQISNKLPKKTKWQIKLENEAEKIESTPVSNTGRSYITPSKR
jgi:hypothetical protein